MGGLGGAAKTDNQNKNPFGASTGSSGSQVSSIFGQASSTPFGSGSQPTGSSFSGSGKRLYTFCSSLLLLLHFVFQFKLLLLSISVMQGLR